MDYILDIVIVMLLQGPWVPGFLIAPHRVAAEEGGTFYDEPKILWGGGVGGGGGWGVPPIGHKSLQVPAIPLLLPTPAPVQPLHPQLLLGLAHRQAGGKGVPWNQTGSALCLPAGAPGLGVCGRALFCIGDGGWGGGSWGLLENVFKTIKLWTFGCKKKMYSVIFC